MFDIRLYIKYSWSVSYMEISIRLPHNSFPYRSSYIHMIEMAEEQIRDRLLVHYPKVFIDKNEDIWEMKEVMKYPHELVWYQSVSTSSNRIWKSSNWEILKETFSDIYSFVDLSTEGYSLRQSLAIVKHSFAGICLDSFMVHGSAAVNAKNVLVILGSSRPECVTYPGQYIHYKESGCPLQPCGMHGYFSGCKREHEHLFAENNCIYPFPKCMDTISVRDVSETLEMLAHNRSIRIKNNDIF